MKVKQIRQSISVPAVALVAFILITAGCGGGGSSPNSAQATGASVVSRGVITGFGSVYVNDIRYRTEGTHFSIDDGEGDESDLRVGMIVTVRGTSDGNNTGSAQSITYDNELKGPVTAITIDPADASRKTLTILGQAVLVTADTTIDDHGGLSFDTIAPNDVLEVSGYVTAAGLTATHIELQDNALDIEIKGHIENLTANSFDIRGFAVSYDSTTKLDDIAALAEGQYVQVKGALDSAGTTLLAREIQGEDEGLDGDMDEAEIKGVISDYNATLHTFMLQGQLIDASRAELEPASLQLADGLTVKVEGRLENAVLMAKKIEQKGRKIKIHAPLSEVDTTAGTVSFNFNSTAITVRVNRQTEIEDEVAHRHLQLIELVAGDFVEMKAFADSSGVINAVEIDRRTADEISIAAPLQDFDGSLQSVVLLGVEFDLATASFADDAEKSLPANLFFDALGALGVGAFIEIRDTNSDAVFDKAQLED
jgi:hypothetical protein